MTTEASALYNDQELDEMLTEEELDYYRRTNPEGHYYVGLSSEIATYLNKTKPTDRTYRMHPIATASEYVFRKMYGQWKLVSAEEELSLGLPIMLYRRQLISDILKGNQQ